jgi:nitroreductase
MIFTTSRELQIASWIDCGCFINSISLISRSFGLDSCIQAAWCHYHDVLRELLGIPDDDVVVSGLSLGYMDSEAPANQLFTERKPLHQLARLLETHSTAEQE